MDIDKPEPVWAYRAWSAIHAASALAFFVFVYLIGPSWPGVLMAFIVGVNLTMAWYFARMGAVIERGNRNVAALMELKEDYLRLAESAGYDPTEPTDQR